MTSVARQVSALHRNVSPLRLFPPGRCQNEKVSPNIHRSVYQPMKSVRRKTSVLIGQIIAYDFSLDKTSIKNCVKTIDFMRNVKN